LDRKGIALSRDLHTLYIYFHMFLIIALPSNFLQASDQHFNIGKHGGKVALPKELHRNLSQNLSRFLEETKLLSCRLVSITKFAPTHTYLNDWID